MGWVGKLSKTVPLLRFNLIGKIFLTIDRLAKTLWQGGETDFLWSYHQLAPINFRSRLVLFV
jgi:hypothetical protein